MNGFKPGKANKHTRKKSEKSSKYSSVISGERNSQGNKVIDDFSEELSHEVISNADSLEFENQEDISKQTFDRKINPV
jgi:hypothetical protein